MSADIDPQFFVRLSEKLGHQADALREAIEHALQLHSEGRMAEMAEHLANALDEDDDAAGILRIESEPEAKA